MRILIPGFWLLAVAPASLFAQEPKEALAQSTKKIAKLESYAFKADIQVESVVPLPGGGQEIPAIEGKYQKDAGLQITIGSVAEVFRKLDRTFIKGRQGTWQEIGKGPRGPGGARGGGGLGAGGMFFNQFKAPHDELRDFEKSLKEVKKAEKPEKVESKECSVYSGDLTDEGVKASPLGRMMGQLAQFGGGGTNAELSGSGRAWIDADGNLLKFEVTTKVSLEFNGNAIEFVMVRATAISGVGETKVEVPEGVQKLLSEKPAEDKKSEDKKQDDK
jgi:hypothetical protein